MDPTVYSRSDLEAHKELTDFNIKFEISVRGKVRKKEAIKRYSARFEPETTANQIVFKVQGHVACLLRR